MGWVTDVFWECPGCKTKNQAQVYGSCEDPKEFPITSVPLSRGLKWNPPCKHCHKYQLVDAPEVYGTLPIIKVDNLD